MRIKKILILKLVIIMLITVVSSCGSTESDSDTVSEINSLTLAEVPNTQEQEEQQEHREQEKQQEEQEIETRIDPILSEIKSDIGYNEGLKLEQNDEEIKESNQEENEENKENEVIERLDTFEARTSNDAPPISGGVLKYAVITDEEFGSFSLNPLFSRNETDIEIIEWYSEGLLGLDDSYLYNQEGICTYECDPEAKSFTITMKDSVKDKIKWHDGMPVTLSDLVFAYEVIFHKDYTGSIYAETLMSIEGAESYHKGEANNISGLVLSEDKTKLTIHFNEFYPTLLYGGIWTKPLARHYYSDIPVSEMAYNEKSRFYPIGFGAFKIVEVDDGNRVKLERFDDYWLGTPKLDGVEIQTVENASVPNAMNEGIFDVAKFDTLLYADNMNPVNYEYLSSYQTVFNYTGFRLGTWDNEKQECVYNPNSKMGNVKLRQAIGYAIDNEYIAEEIYNGLRLFATSIIPPSYGTLHDFSLEGYYYDPEKANMLLNEAGYVDIDGDGFREDSAGNEFVIYWGAMSGPSAELIAELKISQWADVGLRVELYQGSLIDQDILYEVLSNNEPNIDMYDGAWITRYDPNPSGHWGKNALHNYTRYTSEAFISIQNDISSAKAWDTEFLIDRYKAWQRAFFDEIPAIPTLWRRNLVAVNNRVKNYDVRTNANVLHLIELTAMESYK